MRLLEVLKSFVVEGANLVNTGNVVALLGLLILLMLLADQVWRRSQTIKRYSLRAGTAAFALYVVLMLVNFGQFEAAFLVGILWRGLLAGALMTGIASVALGVVGLLLAEPSRWIRHHVDAAVDALRRRRNERRRRVADTEWAAAAAERDRQAAPEIERRRHAEEQVAQRRAELTRTRDRLRYDLRLEYRKVRKLDQDILTNDEFESQLEHALAPDELTEIDRRVTALREVFAAVLAKVPKSHTFESLAQDFVERHEAIDRSVFDDDIKLKLHRWVNLQGEHEVQQLRHRQPR